LKDHSSPEDSENILHGELKKIQYPKKYVRASWGGLVPCGMKGEECWKFFEKLQTLYRSLGFTQR